MKITDHEEIRRVLDAELTHVHTSAKQRRMLYENARGEKAMKKKVSLGLVLAIGSVLIACAALAAAGAFDAIKAVWEDSFKRMNTTALVDIVDKPDVPAYLKRSETEYGGIKEDLIISTVPDKDGLSLDNAIRIAKRAIMEKFGTPEAELDAMGVYPTYYETPYRDEISQWRIYITPRTDVNLDEDHYYPAPGEYLAEVDSPSGKVSACFYYNDDFWPDYANRCWENGSRDYVYERAKNPDFMMQSIENRQRFMDLFAKAGYDMSALRMSDEERLRAMDTDICLADTDLLKSPDGFVLTAVKEMEERCGITRADMDKCHMCAVRAPQGSDTVDICFSYNFNKAEKAGPGPCETLAEGYASRLGYFMICMDARSGKVVKAVHIPWDSDKTESNETDSDKSNSDKSNSDKSDSDAQGILSKSVWTKDDLPEYYRLTDELRALDAGYVKGRDSLNALLNKADLVMRRYGGDPKLYGAQRADDSGGDVSLDRFLYEHHLSEEEIRKKGLAYLLSHTSYSEKDLENASFIVGTKYDDFEHPDQNKVHPTLLVLLEKGNGRGMIWDFQFDMDLNITKFEESEDDLHG